MFVVYDYWCSVVSLTYVTYGTGSTGFLPIASGLDLYSFHVCIECAIYAHDKMERIKLN